MDRLERQKWALGIIDARGGQIEKSLLIAMALGKLGLSHTHSYELVNGLIGSGHVREVLMNRRKTLVILREAIGP